MVVFREIRKKLIPLTLVILRITHAGLKVYPLAKAVPSKFLFFMKCLKTTIVDKNNGTNDKFYRKVAILMYTEMFNFRPEKQLRNENHTEDCALGWHPRDNGHVTH